MVIKKATYDQFKSLKRQMKQLYLEAFPKCERKPWFILKNSIRSGKVSVLIAMNEGQLLGFLMYVSKGDLLLIDYLAVSSKIRSQGTGSMLLNELLRKEGTKEIMFLIECIEEKASNYSQRVNRKRFYLKNNLMESGYYVKGKSGNMEILANKEINIDDFFQIQEYALGKILFRLSKMESFERN